MHKNMATIAKYLPTNDIQYLDIPLAICLNPSGALNAMRQADMSAELVLDAKFGEVFLDLG
jgi:hypothetical protein